MTTPTAPIATRDEILALLTASARKGHVGAMRLLLMELRGDADEDEAPSVIDELAGRRSATG